MKTIASGTIAVMLLGIYAWLIVVACHIVLCAGSACQAPASFNGMQAQALSVITGLVSALVIAELSVAKVGEAPAAHLLAPNATDRAKTVLRWVTAIYLLVWLAAGLAAFLIGLTHPKTLPALTSVGQSWFGIAVAAAYAYLGLRPAS
ncbi:MAG: hypothetical protein ACREPU_14280 [Rhodanobacteraceae bacterium]